MNSILALLDNEKVKERQFKSCFGVSKAHFSEILKHFAPIYEQKRVAQKAARWEGKERKYHEGSGKPPKLPTAASALAFVLYYLKEYPKFDVLGAQFNMSGSSANKLLHYHRKTLLETLGQMKVLPQTSFEDVADFQAFIRDNDLRQLLIDAFERQVNRPQDQQEQRLHFSGKKKRHTVKNTVISTAQRAVLFLGLTTHGTVHDLEQLRLQFQPKLNWFEGLQVLVDLGYLGFDKNYPNSDLMIPKRRKPRRGKNLLLSEEELFPQADKDHNRKVSQQRVWVEHAIRGIKRFNCLINIWRNRLPDFQDAAVLIAAGLWNLHLGVHFNIS